MASQEVESGLSYEQLKEERDFFERKYLQLKKEYEEHLASCTNKSDEDPADFEPAAKIQRLIPSTDPFVALDPELVDIILTYLSPKELLTAMEVSKTWKIFIESRNSRMKRIMDNIVVKLESENFEEVKKKAVEVKTKEVDAILARSRQYKHMKTAFGIELDVYKFPFINFASTLESLEIACVSHEIEDFPQGANFPKLTKLVISCGEIVDESLIYSLMNFVKTSSFPEVTHVKTFEFYPEATSLNQFMEKFPKLKVLHATYDGDFDSDGWPLRIRYNKFESQPKIEALRLYLPYANLLIGLKDTLTEVCIKGLINVNFEWLPHLKKLQHLIIESLDILLLSFVLEFQQGNNLKELSVFEFQASETELNHRQKSVFHQFLRALPALQILSVPIVYKELITFLASHMVNLKKLVSTRASDEALDLHLQLKRREHEFVNTTFELAFETRITDFEKLFDDRYFK